MLKIKTNKGYLDLGGDFTVQIDEKSPVMNDRGSQTVPAVSYTHLDVYKRQTYGNKSKPYVSIYKWNKKALTRTGGPNSKYY